MFPFFRDMRDVEDFFGKVFNQPKSDVIYGDTEVSITVELPGVSKENIELYTDSEKIHIQTRGSRIYKVVILWGTPIDEKTVKATYLNGVLDVTATRTNAQQPSGYRVDVN